MTRELTLWQSATALADKDGLPPQRLGRAAALVPRGAAQPAVPTLLVPLFFSGHALQCKTSRLHLRHRNSQQLTQSPSPRLQPEAIKQKGAPRRGGGGTGGGGGAGGGGGGGRPMGRIHGKKKPLLSRSSSRGALLTPTPHCLRALGASSVTGVRG